MFGVDDVGLLGLASAGMSGLSSLYDFGSAAASGLGSSLLGNFFGNRQRSSQGKLAYELAHYQAALNYKYSQIYNEDNYALARRYAENSASWAVQGLRNAGLNPILAAGGGFNGNLGQAGVSSSADASVPSLNSNERGMDIAEAMRDFASFRASNASAKAASTQADVNKSTVGLNNANQDLVRANTARSVAEANSIRVKSDSEALQALQDALRQGDKSWLGTLFKTQAGVGEKKDSIQNQALDAIDRIVTRLGSDYGNTAKDNSNPVRVYHKVVEPSVIRHSAREANRSRSNARRIMDIPNFGSRLR